MLLLLACTGPTPEPTPVADHAPFPYTVEQLRGGMPVGHVIELRHRVDETTSEWRWTVVEADDAGLVLKTDVLSGEAEAGDKAHTWLELQSHATYAADTPIERRSVTVALGTYEADCYLVAADEANLSFCFALELPGPPLLYTVGAAGRELERFEQVKRY